MYEEIISKLVDRKAIYKKDYKPMSLREKVLSLIVEANKNAPIERRVVPRAALTVMDRAANQLSSLSTESSELGVLREVAKFITAHQDTYKAYEYSSNLDLLPVGHPKSLKNITASAQTARERYAQWLASDVSVDTNVRPLVAAAHSLQPGSLERRHAFARLRVTRAGAVPAFFKIDESPIEALVAAFGFRGGNSSAARRARVALQWRDRKGRWVEMGRGIDFNFRLPNGDIGSAGGTYVGVDAVRGYSTENGKPVAKAGLIEIAGHATIPDGIYSIESANATPVKARISRQALKRAGIKKQPSTRKATAEELTSKNIPNLNDLLATRVDAPSGWIKQDDNSFISDDDYKLIPNDSGFSLHRLDKDGNTGDIVGNVASWSEAQSLAEKDSPEYDKFKESVGIKGAEDSDNAKGIQDARAAKQERLAETIFARRMDGESLDEVADDLDMTREQVRKIESDYMRANPEKARPVAEQKTKEKASLPDGVKESGELPNGIKYTASREKIPVGVFPGREPGRLDGVRVRLSGNTFAQKDLIKKLGFKWNAADKIWRKDFIDGKLFGHQTSVDSIKEQLDGIGGGDVPRYAGDNWDVYPDIEGARNEMVSHLREEGAGDETKKGKISKAFDVIVSASKNIDNSRKTDIPNNEDDRKRTRDDLASFLDAVNASDFPGGPRVEKAKELAQKAIDKIDEKIGTPAVSPKSEAKVDERPTAFTGVDNIEDWSNESVNLHEVEDLLNDWFNELDEGPTVQANYEDAMGPLTEARRMVLDGEWTDLDNPPAEAIDSFREALPSLEDLEKSLLNQGMTEGTKEPEPEFEAAAQQVRDLIDELNNRLSEWDDGLPPTPPSRYTGPFADSGDFGRDVTDTVVDGAESAFDMSKELEEVLDSDASKVGQSIVEQMWDAADSRFDIQDQFNNNFSSTVNKEDFIQAAVDSLKEQLSSILEGAYSERRDLEGDDELEIDFDEEAFINAAEKKYRQLLSDLWDARDEGPGEEPPTPPSTFDYDSAKSVALDSDKSTQERYAAVFDGAKGENIVDYLKSQEVRGQGVKPSELDPSIPIDAEVVFTDGDGQSLTLRYPDGSYHHVDTGAVAENGLIPAESVNDYDAFDPSVHDEFLGGLFEGDGLPYARGAFIDDDRQREMLDGITKDEGLSNRDLWGSTNSIEKPDGKVYDIVLAEMGEPGDDNKTIMQNIVDQANKLGIYVELSPNQTGLAYGDERVVRFTFPEKTVSENLAKKLIGEAPDSNDAGDGILMSRLDNQEDWEQALQEITGNGPDEEPPSPSGGIPPKVPSPSTPSTPGLFKEFDIPAGAFQLRTVDYEPDGRVDEESTDFTDDPERLATKYALPELTAALTQALIGDKDNAVIAQIVDSSVGDDEESLDLEGVDEIVDTPAPRAGRANGSGAGQLEFNKGAEFVPAEALYNAVFLAGGDPNRVIANAYDAVNGNRNNLDKLHNAAGGVPDAEEAKLVDDIFKEIKQIEDASTPEELEQKAANPIDGADEEEPLQELLYNVPVDFDNPDYYNIDPNPYQPSVPDQDENGYTDNPQYIARKFIEADLLEQFEIAITDGSGSVFLVYNSDSPDTGTYEVPAEAVRDALQHRGINTNDVLERIRDESNDLEEPEIELTPETVPAAVPNEAGEIPFDTAVEAIRDFYDIQEDEDFPDGIKILGYLPSRGTLAYLDPWEDIYVTRENGSITKVNYISESFFTDPSGVGQKAGWRQLTPEESSRVYGAVVTRQEESKPESTPSTPEATPPTPAAPQYQYPGPRESGYSPNNTTLVSGRVVVGKGARVEATKDGKLGTVVAIQNNPEYIRIRFDDGTTQVRAASKVRAISTESGAAPTVVTREEMQPSTDIEQRLDKPLLPAPRIARSGDTAGVNDESTRPDFLKGKTQEGTTQSEFFTWRDRDAEVAKAANDRVSLDVIEQEIFKRHLALLDNDAVTVRTIDDNLKNLIGDAYGDRSGISFGGEFFTTRVRALSPMAYIPNGMRQVRKEDIDNKKASMRFEISLDILDVTRNVVGRATRNVVIERKLDGNDNVVKTDKFAYANYLAITAQNKKQKGFGSAYNRWVENWYIANDIEKIKVGAAGGGAFQGGFVWAINGYNWADVNDAKSTLRLLRRSARTNLELDQVEYLAKKIDEAELSNGDYDMSSLPTPMQFALVGWDPEKDPEKGTWLGRSVMIDKNWDGVKHLKPDAREQIQAANYAQIRNARKRVLSKQNIPNVSSEGLSVVESNDFRNDVSISPHYSQIRDALRNNRSLAVLSPDAKNALNEYTTKQLLNKNRSLPLEDVFRLRDGLGNEYRADYGYSDPFNSAEVLSGFSTRDFFDASKDEENSKLKSVGFTVEKLEDVGVNNTFLVTHIASGQKFFVKNDWYSGEYTTNAPGIAELEATTIFRAAGMQGIHEVRAGKNRDDDLLVMSEAGSTIPLAAPAKNAESATRRGIIDGNGVATTVSYPDRFVGLMDAPEDLIRMSLFDILSNNVDRHDGNYMVAFDKATGKMRLFPIDNTLGVIEKDRDSMEDFLTDTSSFAESDAYRNYMPTLIQEIGKDDLMKIYKHEADKIIKNLANPLYQPKGFEMDRIIEKWGTYDAFKDAVSARLNKLMTPGSNEYRALENALRIGYWS